MLTEERLTKLGICLPEPRKVPANFIPCAQAGDLVWVSGTLGTVKDEHGGDVIPKRGKLGREISEAEGYASARQCAINHLAWLKEFLGDLDLIRRVVKMNGYVNGIEGFDRGPWVANGASDLLVEVLGPERGQHARAVVVVAGLAFGAPVEIEMLVEVEPFREPCTCTRP
jgi:enamine deaminase RidA (YjgF/YER057c/UK114 family)